MGGCCGSIVDCLTLFLLSVCLKCAREDFKWEKEERDKHENTAHHLPNITCLKPSSYQQAARLERPCYNFNTISLIRLLKLHKYYPTFITYNYM